MNKKVLFTILTVALIVFCGLSLFGCNQGEVPVENIVITKLPKLEYYRGDFFELDSSEITIYYENGKTDVKPLTLEMLSTYDAQNIGDQTLTIKYENTTAYIKVVVKEAPIYKVEIVDSNYKTQYIQEQILSLKNLNLKVTYSNSFTEIIPVDASMLSGFDTETIGEKQLIVTYKGLTAKYNINVVKKAIDKVSLEVPRKLSYVVGDKIDYTDGKIFIAYNNNTQEYINMEDLLDDPEFGVKINDVATDTFTESGLLKYVVITYYGFECPPYGVTVAELKAKKIEIISQPNSPVINTASVVINDGIIKVTYNNGDEINAPATAKNISDYWRLFDIIDMSAGSIKVTYNNNTSEIISTSDQRVEIMWQEFDNSRLGFYNIIFCYQDLQIPYILEVIDAKEVEIIINRPTAPIYQDSGLIDITQWQYSIKLANGKFRAFEGGTILSNISQNMIVQGTNPIYTTDTAGERSFIFEYKSLDNTIHLTKTVNLDVLAKKILDVHTFEPPTKNVYSQGESIDTSGGRFKLNYNDGSVTDWKDITKDMQITDDDILTTDIAENVYVEFLYVDSFYDTSINMRYIINIVRNARSITYEEKSSTGLKLNYILGEVFDSENLVVKVDFDNGTKTENVFTTAEWTFANTVFDNVGAQNVRIYYGDISSGVYADIPVVVTNEVVSMHKVADFVDFGTVVEGMDLIIPDNAYVVATRENGATEQIKVLSSMTNYSKADKSLGIRQVTISHYNLSIMVDLEVLSRELTDFNIIKNPTKIDYVYTDTTLDLSGMRLNFKFNNNTTAEFSGDGVMLPASASQNETLINYNLTIGTNNYNLIISKHDTNLNDNQYIQQTINVSVFSGTTLLFSDGFDVIYFSKLIEKILFDIPGESDQSIVLNEGEDFYFPSNAVVRVVYADHEVVEYVLSTLPENEYKVVGYDKNKAGIQSVKLMYFFNECNFAVKVRAKLLESIVLSSSSVTVTEGMAISSDDIAIKLHFVDADGVEFDIPKYIDVELNSVICSYNKNAEVSFDRQDENNHWYYEDYYTISYTYNYYDFTTKDNKSITKSTDVLIRINRKSLSGISMRTYPKQVYIEDISGQPASELDLTGGSVLVMYNNGTSKEISLDNANLTIIDNEFDTSEIDNGSEKNQKITVSYTENSVTMSTYYTVVVKDRRYLTVTYEENYSNYTYLFEYGTGESARPNFYVSGYLDYNASRVVLADNSDIDIVNGFSLYYIDNENQESDIWPKDAGIYTLAIKFEGNAINNPFIDISRKIQIVPKLIVVRTLEKTLNYGDTFINEHDEFDWIVQGYNKNGNVVTYTDNPLVYGENKNMVVDINFRITSKGSAQQVVFYKLGDTTIVNANVGTYNLNTYLVEKLSHNYNIVEFISSDLIIRQKDINIVAQSATKEYGQSDPRFEFRVFDDSNNEIGGNVGEPAHIWIGGVLTGFSDRIPNYNLGRNPTDTNNVLDTHEIMAGAANQVLNYNIVTFSQAFLTITPKPITICGQSIEKAYASATPSISFVLKSGFSMAYGENFENVFNRHIFQSGDKYSISIYRSDNLGVDLAIDNDLPITSNVGDYKIRLNIIPLDIPNYEITMDMVDLTIVQSKVDVFVSCLTRTFSASAIDIVVDADEVGWYEYSVDSQSIEMSFESGYLLDSSQITLDFVKEQGINVGKYRLKISTYTHNHNSNFALNLVGDYGDYYQNFINQYYSEQNPIDVPLTAGDDADYSYLIILPSSMNINMDTTGEVYARKTTLWLDTKYFVDDVQLIDNAVVNNLHSALNYKFINKNIAKANLGYFTADDYFGSCDYSYFANTSSRNYLSNGNIPLESDKQIFNYILNGIEGSFVISYDFDYTINPYELDVECLNINTSYTGVAIPMTYSNYSLCHTSDILTIVSDIRVIYNDTVVEITASKIQEAGVYNIRLIGVSNYNYCLSQDTLDRVKNITINPIELKILIDQNRLTRDYNGRNIQPLDNKWVDIKGENDDIGYYRTSSYKIVNDVLSEAPKTISIYPVDATTNDIPRNAGEHELFIRINSVFKNLNVLFVKLNPSWNSGDSIDNKYMETDYTFTITKKKITLYNWENCNKKIFDNSAPLVSNLNQLIINNTAPGDVVTSSDLVFNFSRDMTKVASTLTGIVSQSDMVSAGYFDVEVSIKNTNANWQNYYFEINGNENYYLIKRVAVPITLNTSNSSLTKQYDKKAPSGVFGQLNVGQTTIYDNIYFDIDIVSYYKDNAWLSWSGNGVYDVGDYSYNLRAKCKIDEDTYIYFEDADNQPLYDETYSSYKLLSWNYCYYISSQIGLDTDNCDGVYKITKKDVAISLDNAKNEIFAIGVGQNAERYVYSHIYNNQDITLSNALSQVNSIYKIVDKNGDYLDLVYYDNFVKRNLTGTGTSIKNAGEYFELFYNDMANLNKNFNITNKPIIYAVKKLDINLTLTFENTDNENLSSMTYGDKAFQNGKVNFVLDFQDINAFNLATGYSYTSINQFISSNGGDFSNDKMVINSIVFSLGEYYTSIRGSMVSSTPYVTLNVGCYNPTAVDFAAANYQINIIGIDFVVNPKEMVINGLYRDYFDKQIKVDSFIDGGSINAIAENAIISSWIFIDNTKVNDDASNFASKNNYYAYILKNAMVTNNANYTLTITECTGLIDTNSAYYYIPLTVRRVNLVVKLTNFEGNTISVQYGHKLMPNEYKFTFGNIPIIDIHSPDYNPATESNKQEAVFDIIKNQFINTEAIINTIKATSVGSYSLTLSDYIKDGADTNSLTNYTIELTGEVAYIIRKIIINLEIINNAETDYNENGYFSAIFDEAYGLEYSTSSNQRLTYSFAIQNPNAIIRPDGVTINTLVEYMTYILGLEINQEGFVVYNNIPSIYSNYNDFVTNYINTNIRYQINTQEGDADFSAGLCKIKITDNWYNSQNYTLSCAFKNIMIYPKIISLGDSNNQIPFSAISLSGLPADYDTAIQNLSMNLQLFYTGFNNSNSSEWVDVRKRDISDYYQDGNYIRNWSINVVDGEEIVIGNDIRMTITMSESFYNNLGGGTTAVINTITSNEFVVRLYAPEQTNTINSQSSQIVKGIDSTVYNYQEKISENYTYYFSENDQSTTKFNGKFDIFSIKLRLNPAANSSSYHVDLLLFENAFNSLTLRIGGGSGAAYQIIMKDIVGNNIYYSDILTGLDSVDLFDGVSHTLKIYIDKLGYLTNYQESSEGESIIVTSDRYYKMLCVIDDTYSCPLEYLGGICTETITINPVSGLLESDCVYTKYIDFDNSGNFGFVIVDSTIFISSFSADNMGIKLTNEGYVSDFMLWPSAFSNNYSYYITDNGNLNIDNILQTISFNSGYGYNNIYLDNIVRSDKTGEIVENELERGTYLVTIKSIYRVSSTVTREIETKTVRLIVSESYFRRVGIKDMDIPNYSNPTIYQSANGANYFTDMLGSFSYSKMVFDYSNLSNDASITTIFLKTNENRTSNMQIYDENYPNYRGLALKISYDETTQVYSTELLLRQGVFYVCIQLPEVDWNGNRNILETRYCKSSGLILITLYRDGQLLLSFTVKNGLRPGLSAEILKNIAVMSSYISLSIYNTKMNMYAMELDGGIVTNLDLKDSSIDNDTVLIDGDGAPISTFNTNTYFRFRATGTNFKLLFANTVGALPTINEDDMMPQGERKRGAYLLFTKTGVSLRIFKYNTEFYRQTINNVNLLDGLEHNVTISITKEIIPEANLSADYRVVECYKVDITIDGITYSKGLPVWNDLHEIRTVAGTGQDAEREPDVYFLNDYRFLGIMPNNAIIEVKDMILY